MNLVKYRIASTATAVLLGAAAAPTAQTIDVRVSFKAVVSPAEGTVAPGVSEVGVDAAIAVANDLLRDTWRGYRLVRVGPLIPVGALGDPSGPGKWYATDFWDEDEGAGAKDEMEAAAQSDPDYAWQPWAVNVYLTLGQQGRGGGVCSFPSEGDEVVILGGTAHSDGVVLLHELGHYFGLCHTQGCPCGDCDDEDCPDDPESDGIADTLEDRPCWDPDAIATVAFGATFAGLAPAQQELVSDVFLNVMSYHADRSRLTEGQLDRWTLSANLLRPHVVSGSTWAVAPSGFTTAQDPYVLAASPYYPFGTVNDALVSASPAGGDVLLLWPGSYAFSGTIAQPVTLRATLQGPVVLGSP